VKPSTSGGLVPSQLPKLLSSSFWMERTVGWEMQTVREDSWPCSRLLKETSQGLARIWIFIAQYVLACQGPQVSLHVYALEALFNVSRLQETLYFPWRNSSLRSQNVVCSTALGKSFYTNKNSHRLNEYLRELIKLILCSFPLRIQHPTLFLEFLKWKVMCDLKCLKRYYISLINIVIVLEGLWSEIQRH